jgi:hypothetical protein
VGVTGDRTKEIKMWIHGWKHVFISVIGRMGVPGILGNMILKKYDFSGYRTGLSFELWAAVMLL